MNILSYNLETNLRRRENVQTQRRPQWLETMIQRQYVEITSKTMMMSQLRHHLHRQNERKLLRKNRI